MAGDTSNVKPTNAIVVDSINLHAKTLKVENATSMYAGRLVKKGTNDDDMVVNTGATAIGWLGYEQTAKKYRPATVDTIYVVNAYAAMINGPGIKLVASLAGGVTAVPGTPLTYAPSGELTGGVVGTDQIYAIAEETKTTTGATSADCIVRSMI